jgi:multimeric flavodoxin WrbA
MLVLGLQGSPRQKGNTNYLLSAFLDEAARLGAQTHLVEVAKKNIVPCQEYVVCEKKGFCPIDDDMKHEIYPLLRQAEVIVAASPIFFYNVTAQLKALIDRSQTLWARKYRLKLKDPAWNYRRGFLLSVAATKGKNLFEALNLTAQYFFDAVDADYKGSLTYRGIEKAKDMAKHPTVLDDVKKEVNKLLNSLVDRKKILFACRENACRSQMASAFAQYYAGDKLDIFNGGSKPAEKVNPVMAEVMQEKGIDMAFRVPITIEEAIFEVKPELIVTMGCGEECPFVPGATMRDWDLPDPSGESAEFMRNVRDEVEKRVKDLINELT